MGLGLDQFMTRILDGWCHAVAALCVASPHGHLFVFFLFSISKMRRRQQQRKMMVMYVASPGSPSLTFPRYIQRGGIHSCMHACGHKVIRGAVNYLAWLKQNPLKIYSSWPPYSWSPSCALYPTIRAHHFRFSRAIPTSASRPPLSPIPQSAAPPPWTGPRGRGTTPRCVHMCMGVDGYEYCR